MSGEVLQGDAADLLAAVPDNSVDMIFTDPPYTRKTIHLYSVLAQEAQRVLRPGRLVMAYCGALFFPEVFDAFRQWSGRGLEWFWLFRDHHEAGFPRMFATHTLQAGKPILAFFKPTAEGRRKPGNWAWVVDEFRGGTKSKTHHKWEQHIGAALMYIEAYTNPGELVLDPFCGSGTFLVAAQRLDRRFLGIDISAKSVESSRKRLREDKERDACGASGR